jgi:hypothetical protein
MKKLEHIRSLQKVPKWIVKGALANFHGIMDNPPSVLNAEITSEPFLLGGHTACVFIQGVSGCVSIGALTKPEPQHAAL